MAGIKHYSTGYANTLLKANGKSHADILKNGVIRFFGNAMPANADLTEGANHLLEITLSSGAFTPGVATNGINLDVATANVVNKKSGEFWSGVGTADAGTGTVALWCRWYSNARVTGASTTSERVDLDISTSGTGSINLGSANIIQGVTTTLDNASLTMSLTA